MAESTLLLFGPTPVKPRKRWPAGRGRAGARSPIYFFHSSSCPARPGGGLRGVDAFALARAIGGSSVERTEICREKDSLAALYRLPGDPASLAPSKYLAACNGGHVSPCVLMRFFSLSEQCLVLKSKQASLKSHGFCAKSLGFFLRLSGN